LVVVTHDNEPVNSIDTVVWWDFPECDLGPSMFFSSLQSRKVEEFDP
jgi:hypothetical protein